MMFSGAGVELTRRAVLPRGCLQSALHQPPVERVGRPESRERSRQLVEAQHGLIFLEGAERVGQVASELFAVDGPHPSSVTVSR